MINKEMIYYEESQKIWIQDLFLAFVDKVLELIEKILMTVTF